MLYALLRAMAGIALRWYYRGIQVEGLERVPYHRPLLVVVNHPNALVDAMLVAWAMPRRVLLTAKSTIFVNPLANTFFKWVGVVPLYRASDVQQGGASLDPARNRGTFRAVIDMLRRRQCVLIFPEGKTHDEPSLAPLKSGAARMALEAVASGATDLAVLPIGLVFERKDAPRSRVLVEVGEPLVVADWPRPDTGAADMLTREIDARLRAVTTNYDSTDDAARARRLSSLVAALFDDRPQIRDLDTRFLRETAIAKRLDQLVGLLELAGPTTRATADQLVQRLDAVQRVATKHRISLVDVRIPLDAFRGARFVLREGWVLAIGAPIAAWGRINHWLPFTAARAVAMRSVESAADPAMRTVVAGAVFVLLAYLVQTITVALLWGPAIATLYLVSLPLAADVNFYLSDRFRRARRRARAFLLFRRDPALKRWLDAELTRLRADVVTFDASLHTATS
jgi:glycerol-3-phosphate O-acyltransferase / dihydroxyacetone phosphate acyltransferase